MNDALVELLNQKPFEFITVKEICTLAGVNRSTFYLHYETIGDLLADTVDATNKDFLSYFGQNVNGFAEKIAACPLNELMLVTPEFLSPYLRFIMEHKAVFHAAFSHPTAMGSEDKFRSLYRYIFDPILERFSVPAEKRRYMVQFYLQGILAVIQMWVLNDCSEDVSDIAGIITDCVSAHRRMPYEKQTDQPD